MTTNEPTAIERLRAYIAQNPNATPADAARATGLSKQRISQLKRAYNLPLATAYPTRGKQDDRPLIETETVFVCNGCGHANQGDVPVSQCDCMCPPSFTQKVIVDPFELQALLSTINQGPVNLTRDDVLEIKAFLMEQAKSASKVQKPGFKMADVVSVEANFREQWPWAYTLSCGHVLYGDKSKYERGGPVHPKRLRCLECYPKPTLWGVTLRKETTGELVMTKVEALTEEKARYEATTLALGWSDGPYQIEAVEAQS